MPLIKTMTAPNGAVLNYHRVSRVEVTAAGAETTIQSWPDEAAHLAGLPPLWNSHIVDPAATALLAQQEAAVAADPNFDGATIVADEGLALELAKQRRWAEIKAKRDLAEFGVVTWDDSEFDANERAQARIQGSVQLANMALAKSEPWSVDWTLADNSVRTMSAEDMIALGLALAQQVLSAHVTARALREQLDAAESLEDVAAVVWPG